MRRRRTAAALAASPTMVGAVTTLIVIVAVFLAYNANNGLPFVPSYRLSAEVPNARALVRGNEVRLGGVRVGLIEGITPESYPSGRVTARLDLKLDTDIRPLPVDSTVVVRSRSALGLKYLEITKGRSAKGYAEGAVIPPSAAKPTPVEIDDVLNTFDVPTRAAVRTNLVEFGDALAGRGPTLNAVIGRLDPLVQRLEPVMRNLGSPRTRLERFVVTLAATAAEVAPVAEQQARALGELETTFGALASVARPFLQETISETPPTLDEGIRSLPAVRPFLADSSALFADLRPGAAALRASGPRIADALEAGVPVLRNAPAFNAQLAPTAGALRDLANDAGARGGIDRLTQTAAVLSPTLRFVTPAQTVCNYLTILARNIETTFGFRVGSPATGTAQRFTVFQPASGPNSEGTPSSGPANGGGEIGNFLHANPYPNTAAPGQPRECEAANEPYAIGRQVIGNPPGNQGTDTALQPGKEN